MAEYPPFMNSYGLIPKILQKIKEAKTPPRFTQDFLGTSLGFSSGSARPFIPFAKRIGLISTDGSPTDLYHKFRDANHSKGAMARAIKTGYAVLYDSNEYAHKLDKTGLEGLVVQKTGLDSASATLRAIVNSFEALRGFADFEQEDTAKPEGAKTRKESPKEGAAVSGEADSAMNISYTFNLNLPKTDDIAVFNAIFRAIRDNLLKR